jgi:hypothetical protein
MSQYAENTSVPVERSRAEIERMLHRFGAERFLSGWDQEQAYIAWSYHGRAYRRVIRLPDREEFNQTPARRLRRSVEERNRAWEQACRSAWRGLALLVKAKLIAVQDGNTSFEDEFLAHALLPGGETVSQWLEPQIQALVETGRMPKGFLMEPASAGVEK